MCLEGENLRARAPRGILSDEVRALITRHREELIRRLAAGARHHLVTLQKTGALAPLYMIHPWGGGLAECRQLAGRFRGKRPVYGLMARGLDGVEEPFNRIEDMAEAYLSEIREFQPAGPYHLAGYCCSECNRAA